MTHDDELDREIRAHLDLETEERRAAGASDDEARFAARRRFGNVGLVKEAVRATRRLARFDALGQDLRYAARGLVRAPAFSIAAILTLGLGIGANTSVFTLINALLLRKLPVTEPGRLVQVSAVKAGNVRQTFSYVGIRAFAAQPGALIGLCGFGLGDVFAVGAIGSSRQVTGTWMTGDCYRVLRVPFALGRGFAPEDDWPEGGANGLVAVVSNDYWRRALGARDDVVGTTITVDGIAVRVVGVTAPGFAGPNVGRTADITMPVSALPRVRPGSPPILRPGMNWLRLFARLQPDVSREQAAAQLNVAWTRIIEVELDPSGQQGMRGARITLTPGGTGWSELRDQFTRPLLVLFGIVALVLLIACANLASLLLSRASFRGREFAVRFALGAGRGRLMRQVLTESVLLATIGGVVAVAFARFSSAALVSALSAGRARPIALDLRPDGAVLGVALATVVTTSVLFGLAPAIRATAIEGSAVLNDSSRSRGRTRGRLASVLVSMQTALSLVLVAGATLFAQTLRNLTRVDSGFRHDGVTLVSVEIPRSQRDSARQSALAQETLDALRDLPGVMAASVSGNLPASGGGWTLSVTRDDDPATGDADAEVLTASPSYFAVFGISVLAGRGFTRADGPAAPPVMIINASLARERFGGMSPIGRRIRLGGRPKSYTIIGVAHDVMSEGPRRSAGPAVYLSFFQEPAPQLSGGPTIALLTDRAVVGEDAIRATIQRHVPMATANVSLFKTFVDATLLNERLLAVLAIFFGVLALSLVAVGLYGLLAFGVSGRTTEIGVRGALGATSGDVLWLVMSDALRLVGVGVALGLPAVWASTRLVSGMLFGLSPTDPSVIAVSIGLIVIAAVVAAYLPALRAVRINPATALKYE